METSLLSGITKMLEILGYDILQKIVYQLEQDDCVHLSMCCKKLHKQVIPRLFSVVSVGSTRTYFTNTKLELNSTQIPCRFLDASGLCVKKVNINTIYCLNSFLKQLISHPEYCTYVRVLSFEGKIPDIPELKLVEYLQLIFPHLVNLTSFKWLNNEYDLDMDLIHTLPNFTDMLELGGNFKFNEVSIDFPVNELKEFNLSNFMFSDKLININMSNFPELQKLALSRFNTTSTALSNLDLLSTGISDLENSKYLSNLFNVPLNSKLSLSELALKNMLMVASDANILIENINLDCLNILRITDCNEVLFDNNLRVFRRNPPGKFFLDIISPHLTNLKHLELDLYNELNYNNKTFNFISSLPKSLCRMVIGIKFNGSESLTCNLVDLLKSITQHKSLIYLNLDFKVMDNVYSNVKPKDFFYDVKILLELSKLESLQYLGLSINNYQLTNFMQIAKAFKTLKILQLNIVDDHKNTRDIRSNTLIDKEYLEYSNSFLKIMESDQCNNIARDFNSILDDLSWIYLRLTEHRVYHCVNNEVYVGVGTEEFFNDIVEATMTS